MPSMGSTTNAPRRGPSTLPPRSLTQNVVAGPQFVQVRPDQGFTPVSASVTGSVGVDFVPPPPVTPGRRRWAPDLSRTPRTVGPPGSHMVGRQLGDGDGHSPEFAGEAAVSERWDWVEFTTTMSAHRHTGYSGRAQCRRTQEPNTRPGQSRYR